MTTARPSIPYAPPSNVVEIIRRFRERNLPDEISPQLMKEVGVSPGNVHRTLAALRFLNLIDESGVPLPAFHSLQMATEDDYAVLFEGLVRTAYSEVFRVVDPGKDTETIIANHFRRYQPVSQRGRMVTLFLALCGEGGIPVLSAPRQRTSRQGIAGAHPRPTSRAAKGRPVPQASNQPHDGIAKTDALPVGSLRDQYLNALIDAVRQITSRGEFPPEDLLNRIEKLLDIGSQPKLV